MKAVLIPNIAGFPSVSMVRYAEDLGAALRRVGGAEWEFERLEGRPPEAVRRLLPGERGEKWAGRMGRFVTYPAQAGRAKGDVYHVLDHSHANLITSLPGEKSVVTCHDIIPLLAAKGLIALPTGRATRFSFPLRIQWMRRCRYIIVVSESTKRDLMEHGGIPAEQIIVAHNGVKPAFLAEAVDRDAKTAAIRARLDIPLEAKVIIHVGNSLRYKNTPTVLRAVKHLTQDKAIGKDVYLLRMGSALLEDEAELAATLGIADRVKWAGSVPDDAAFADHYRAGDVLAFPSIYEGFGWPPLEAMACGTPVVTSNAASLPEIVGEAGLTVNPMDDEALANGLYRILTERELRETLIARGKERAAGFTWENCAGKVLSVYNTIAESGRIA